MSISFCNSVVSPSMGAKNRGIERYLKPFKSDRTAVIPAGDLLKGVNLNGSNPFDTFKKVDDATRKINFVKSQEAWDACLEEERIEFQQARAEYLEKKSPQNYAHMQEEMGDIFFTAASMARESGIDPEDAFKDTVRKNGNRLNLMEKMSRKNLADCTDAERRGLWNNAKRKLYDAQSFLYSP